MGEKIEKKELDWEVTCEICKVKKSEQMVYGWASVSTKKGKDLVDHQGHIIKIDEIKKAAHNFMVSVREAGEMHEKTSGIGTVVESLVVTEDIKKALNIDDDKTGWFIGMKVEDSKVWKKVEDGTYKSFSIGGNGFLSPV